MTGARGAVARAALPLLVWAALASPAFGQGPERKRPPAEITGVDFGFDGTLPADRWSPVRVWINSEKPFEGVLTLEYAQDATQRARVSIPVVTTPGTPVPFELAACPPVNTVQMDLRLEGGRWGTTIRYDQFPGVDGSPLPTVDSTNRRIVIIGESSAQVLRRRGDAASFEVGEDEPPPPAPPAPAYARQSGAPTDPWAVTTVSPIEPASMPLAWMCWEGTDVVITSADAVWKADPRARAALLDWVHWGGRLVLQVDPAGSRWAELLGTGAVEADESRPVVIGAEARAASRIAAAGARPQTPDPGPGAAVPARLLRLTPGGRRDGWIAAWGVEGATDDSGGLLARGPVGLGMVTLLGVDPARIPRTVDAAATREAWRGLILGEYGAMPEHARELRDESQWYGWTGWGDATLAAVRAAIERITMVPPIGDGVFVIIAAAMFSLALLVGPVDRFVLRRRGLAKWSWLSALAWIGMAGGVALAAPALVRTGESMVTRAAALDAIQLDAGSGVWQSGIVAIWAGTPVRATVEPRDGAWWRGVSAGDFWGGTPTGFPALATVLQGGAAGRSATPLRIGMPQWTFRTIMEQRVGEVSPRAPRASVTRREGGWVVEVSGVPGTAELTRGGLHTQAGWFPLAFAQASDGAGRSVWVGECVDQVKLPDDAWRWAPGPDPNNPYAMAAFSPAACTMLPGARGRTEAIHARVAGGGWACVAMEITGSLGDDGVDGVPNAARGGVTVVRTLVPLGEEPR